MKNLIILAILVAISVFCLAEIPPTPENVTICISGANIVITWDTVADVTGYVIYAKDIADTTFQFLTFSESTSYISPISVSKSFYQIVSYTGNLRQRIFYNLSEAENLPTGCNMTVALEPRGHRSFCQVVNNSNRMIGYQIKHYGYGHTQILQNNIFQDRLVSVGWTSLLYQGQDDRRWRDLDYNPPLESRDLPLNVWIDFNLVIYDPNHFPNQWQSMGDFSHVPDFWYALHEGGPNYSSWIEEEFEKRIMFHEDGTFDLIDR